MSTLTSAYLRARWLHVPSVILMILLQRLPMLRAMISTEVVISSGAGSVLKGVLASIAAMGAVQTVAGATALNPAEGQTGNPALGTVGQSFTGGFSVVGAPANAASYQITGTIPAGLTVTGMVGDTVNASVVTITGTPTEAGSFPLSVRAWNGLNRTGNGGSPTFTYTITISPAAATSPSITTQPISQTVTAGANVSFTVAASGSPVPTLQWRKDGVALSGATTSTLSLSNVTAGNAGSYTVVATNSAGSATSNAAVLTVNTVTPTGLSITQHPSSTNVAPGASITFTASATASGAVTYQWFRDFSGGGDPEAIPGATASAFTINSVQAAQMGFYFARITGDGETKDSSTAVLTTVGTGSRLANLSTRGRIAAGGELTPGFVLSGNGSKPLMIRAVGPQLIAFGLDVGLVDPVMEVIPLSGNTAVLTNDNWGAGANAASLPATFNAVGAFGLVDASLDAAVLDNVQLPNAQGNRGYTVRIKSTSATSTGIALAEVYDPQPLGSANPLVNVSARGFSGTGIDALVPGFVIEGPAAKTMLVRVVAPSLAAFGVPDTMADPKLRVVPLGQNYTIASNDNWGGASALKNAFNAVGAFPLAADSSLDAAVVVRLPPGGYTVVIDDGAGAGGVVLVEAYDLD